jgi:hypothetical protein
MNRTFIATAILLGATTLGMGAYAQTGTVPSGSPGVSTGPVPGPVSGGPTTSGGRPTTTGGVPTPSGSSQQPHTLGTLDRDVHQQDRIEDGLQSGRLTTKEGAQLEQNQARINALQAKDMRDGSLSPAERAQLNRLQDQQSRAIQAAKDNAKRGNPMSASSQNEQAAVQRDINQQTRIQQGVHDNSLSTREAGNLEAGQARNDERQYMAGRDGNFSDKQANQMQAQENRQSDRIRHQKHDRQTGHR